jgi:serine/threonine protein kinase
MYVETYEEIEEEVNFKKIEFDGIAWNKVSTDAKDLLKGMLDRDPEKRLTVEQILGT